MRTIPARALTMGTTVAMLMLAACQPARLDPVWVTIIPRDSVDAIDVQSIRPLGPREFRAFVRNGGGEHDVGIDCGSGALWDYGLNTSTYLPPIVSAYCAKAGR